MSFKLLFVMLVVSFKEKKACGAASEEALEPKVQVGDLVLAILSSV